MGFWSTLKSLFRQRDTAPAAQVQYHARRLVQLSELMSEAARAATGPRKQEPQLLPPSRKRKPPFPQEEQRDVEDTNEPSGHQGKIKELREGGDFAEKDLSPRSLSSFIGQEVLKNDLRKWLETVKREGQPFPHLLLCGPPEIGKKTLAFILAREMGVEIRSCHSDAIRLPGDLAAILTNLEADDLLLLEEIESLSETILDLLVLAIEDQTVELVVGQGPSRRTVKLPLKPFTLVGTTTKPFQVDKRLRRWLIAYDFAPYTVEQISEIIQHLARQQGLRIDPAAAGLLADYCERTVGNARVLLKRVGVYARSSQSVTYDIAQEALKAFHYLEQPTVSTGLVTKLLQMTGVEFEEFVATVFRGRGYAVELTPGSGDHGIDLLMRKGNELVAVQCKRWSAPVGEPVVRDFFGSLINVGAQLGFIVTTSTFTAQAFTFAQGKPLQLIDLDALVELVAQTGGFQVKS